MVACDKLWTYLTVRCGAGRQGCRSRTVVVEEADWRHWIDFEVGDRSEATFLRLYARRPEAKWHYSNAYPVYRARRPPGPPVVGKGGAVNRNEGLPSVWRGQLNRLARSTRGYTRKTEMLVYPWPCRFGGSG